MSVENNRNAASIDQKESTPSSRVPKTHHETMNSTQIQKLVRLLDQSDIAEIELNRADEGLHLVLRKLKTPEPPMQVNDAPRRNGNEHSVLAATPSAPMDLHSLKAHMVGVFHSWLKPHGENLLVTAGDLVKPGQIIGTIEALTILNEVQVTVAGQVTEVVIQDGQFVEYGQPLIIINKCEGMP